MFAQETEGSATAIDRELHTKLVAIFMDVFQVEIEPEVENIQRSEIMAWDSVNHLRLVTTIEEVFQVNLTDEDVVTLADLCALKKILLKQGVLARAG